MLYCAVEGAAVGRAAVPIVQIARPIGSCTWVKIGKGLTNFASPERTRVVRGDGPCDVVVWLTYAADPTQSGFRDPRSQDYDFMHLKGTQDHGKKEAVGTNAKSGEEEEGYFEGLEIAQTGAAYRAIQADRQASVRRVWE